MVRSGDCLERLSRPGTVFFDKTGTLTQGRMRVTDWQGTSEVLRDIARIESQVNHPIAKAIVDYAATLSLDDVRGDAGEQADELAKVQQKLGRGVSGSVNGCDYEIGSLRLLEADNVTIDESGKQHVAHVIEAGSSPVVVIRDGVCRAVLGVSDPLRRDAGGVVESLRRRGWQVQMLSGDHQAAVTRVAAALGVDEEYALGGLFPEDKLAAIRAAIGSGPVLMVGDGVNDAAALAAADVGIAVRGGARASLAAAPVVIADGKLRGVLDLIDGARRTRRTIGRNFAISIGYNIVAVALAMTGWITPLIAAALMPTSSLTVLGLTLATPHGPPEQLTDRDPSPPTDEMTS